MPAMARRLLERIELEHMSKSRDEAESARPVK
jgi:hypothetical protein